ncbi:hypothetical protein B0T26DRAFT_679939 [Lasiosphaeria miniovina]|uniref:Uncharacterized protein n=1 Tax=Lasiosphaeria miniovina TaxID=1954250 RepID=A0AA39ZZ42_9PEZI|nr:uncharacterized protein B0T26DRAFT_679939 [Lasiosphaeria miniovina]KAK0706230.1 hypothetical protein B0T26DRAFT_679939 [Lasiosphaeria miniovina]
MGLEHEDGDCDFNVVATYALQLNSYTKGAEIFLDGLSDEITKSSAHAGQQSACRFIDIDVNQLLMDRQPREHLLAAQILNYIAVHPNTLDIDSIEVVEEYIDHLPQEVLDEIK